MRLKRRYVICQALTVEDSDANSNNDLNPRDLLVAIKEKVEALFGDIGMGSFGTLSMIPFYDSKSRIFVLRTSREGETNMRLAISCVSSVKGRNLIIRTLAVSGSNRTCTEKLRATLTTLVENSNYSESEKVERHEHYKSVTANLEYL